MQLLKALAIKVPARQIPRFLEHSTGMLKWNSLLKRGLFLIFPESFTRSSVVCVAKQGTRGYCEYLRQNQKCNSIDEMFAMCKSCSVGANM